MPGITGIISKRGMGENAAALRQMLKCMSHESFYTSGEYSNQSLGLWIGWTNHKSSFSDCLPIWNETKDICLIFSGEDYTDQNEIEIIRSKGHDFQSDNASYLVHLFEELDLKFIEKLNGRFSGVLIDIRKKKTVLFNDRYSLARIYYHDDEKGFYFASEAKALLKVLPKLRQLNPTSLGEYFSCGCTLQNRALFSGISLLPGGACWTFCPEQRIKKENYFQKESWERQTPLSAEEYYDRLKYTWIHILPRYCRGNEHIALSLTGGKDSRMILAWSKKSAGELPCYSFSSMFRDPEDVKLSRTIANICHQPHHTIRVGKEFISQFQSLAERTVYLTDGVMDVSGTPDLYVNTIARQLAKIRLTGNYGQEILRGELSFKPFHLNRNIFNPDFFPFVERAEETYFNELDSNRLSFVAFKQVPWHHFSRLSLELSQLTMRSPYLDNDVVKLSFQLPKQLCTSNKPQLWLIVQGNPQMGRVRTDRGVRFHSIPLITNLNHFCKEITFKAEYAYDYGMPQWLAKIDNSLQKLHLERIFLGRHKFYHFRIWYRDELSDYIKSILLDPIALSRSYLNAQFVEKLVTSHTKGLGNYTSEIHRLLGAELMQRTLIEKN